MQLPVVDRHALCSSISSFSPEKLQYVYLIIMHYSVTNNVVNLGALDMGPRGIKFNTNVFPEELCVLLQRFVNYMA